MDRFPVPGQFFSPYTAHGNLSAGSPAPSSPVVCSSRLWAMFCSAFCFPSGKFWFPVSASSKVSCPGQLIGFLSCMPSSLIPCPGQFILSLPCLVLRLHVLFPSPGQFLVFLSCSVLRFSTPWPIFCFRALASSLCPWPVQFSVLVIVQFRTLVSSPCPCMSCSVLPFHALASSSVLCLSVLRFYALDSSSVPCLCQFSVSAPLVSSVFPCLFCRVLRFLTLATFPVSCPGQFSHPISVQLSFPTLSWLVLRFPVLVSFWFLPFLTL